ncbi:exodeoxyribonuclease I [Methylomonas sp. SURF-2]|uniref:Exodeoxyribonuclease I n=1 Tax=Methylomonas subterranea TaxID=2952225 RepID=A0ABT1TF77_9GAMM|nr:exodeoxyribonuclease I [Methylomonas sp. SURF-2]MCQ8103906.1 exodeoxyribonuclease I [Methylomonas sp. SURF-2]
MSAASFYWHDYETFGTDPQRDRACQFAGVRTDTDFNIIGEPLMVYCKTADDYLPNPEACLITGITPQLATEKGVCEAEFIGMIHAQLAQAGTCGIGYNSIRFDDEVTRNLLYRNFYDPYAREWQNGNSRWDLIDIARAARALRPDGINWPLNADGVASFRLEELTLANDIAHQSAHDALSDVYATIALARLIKQKQPKLYAYLYANRHKQTALGLLDLGRFKPLVHVSGRFPASKNCLAVVLPLYPHPRNGNEVIVYDLSVDPEALLALCAEEIQQRLFTASQDLPENVERIALKTVHINKSPVLAPLSVIRPVDEQRLGLDLDRCRQNLTRIQAAAGPALEQKLAAVFSRAYADTPADPDLMIYSGGFFSPRDKAAMQKIRQTPAGKLANIAVDFDDARLPEMLFRYRGRNYPDSLSEADGERWRQFCRQRLLEADSAGGLARFREDLRRLQSLPNLNQPLLAQLEQFACAKQLRL